MKVSDERFDTGQVVSTECNGSIAFYKGTMMGVSSIIRCTLRWIRHWPWVKVESPSLGPVRSRQTERMMSPTELMTETYE